MLSAPADLSLRASGLLLGLLVVAVCARAEPGSAGRATAPPPVLTSYGEMPVRLGVPVKAEEWTALHGGATRVVVHIQNQVPSRFYSRTFHVSLVGPAAAQRVEVDELSTQPDNARPGGGPPAAQNFAINLHE